MIEAGFAPGSEMIWEHHYGAYWDLTQRTYREEMDPTYDGTVEAGFPFCASGTPYCDADYVYAARDRLQCPCVEDRGILGHERYGQRLCQRHELEVVSRKPGPRRQRQHDALERRTACVIAANG